MRIIPVIDLKGGQVVHAVAGRRDQYQPIRSAWAADANPATIARGFVRQFGFSQVYLADLDAIAGCEPDWPAWQAIGDCGLELLVDAGIATVERARAVNAFQSRTQVQVTAVVGSERIRSTDELRRVAELGGSHSPPIFSLDLDQGTPRVAAPEWSGLPPDAIVAAAVSAGYRRLILLDLSAVGTGCGPRTVAFCREVRGRFPDLELISGGGVRDAADLATLFESGCHGVLVASALHSGRLHPGDLDRFGDGPSLPLF